MIGCPARHRLLPVTGALAAGGGAVVLLTASVAQERAGLHVFIIAERVTGQVFVDKRVEGPFRGTPTAAEREKERLETAAAQKGETVSQHASTFEPGNCIVVYKTANSTRFTATVRESSDMDRRLRTLRQGKPPVTIVFDKHCL